MILVFLLNYLSVFGIIELGMRMFYKYNIGNCFTKCSAFSHYLQVCVIMYFSAGIVLPFLNAECQDIRSVSNGIVVGDENTEGSTRQITCDIGFVSNSSIITCLNGTWFGTEACTPRKYTYS